MGNKIRQKPKFALRKPSEEEIREGKTCRNCIYYDYIRKARWYNYYCCCQFDTYTFGRAIPNPGCVCDMFVKEE